MMFAFRLRWWSPLCSLLLQLTACSGAPPAEKSSLTAGSATAPSSAGGAGTPSAGAGNAGAAGGSASQGGNGGVGGSSVNPTSGASAGGSAGAGGATAGAGGALTGSAAWTNTPFIMDTWFWNDMPGAPSAVTTVKQTGFAGLALSADHDVAGYVAAAAAAQPLSVVGIWVPAAVDEYPTGIVDSVATTGGLVMLSLNGAGFAISDPAGDAKALALVGKLADECKEKGLPGVALYPHVGFWLERVSDAVRLASKAARSDVGVVFNQYHWMKAEGGKDLGVTLKSAEPFLKIVTINGSDLEASILPLGEGAYDVQPILRTLTKLDFHGSVGLQGYSIAGDISQKLQSSKHAFDALLDGVK